MGDEHRVYARRDDIPYSQAQFEELGRGRFGTVTKVERKSPPHEIYAMKSIDVRVNEVTKIQEEIKIVKDIQYVHIIRIIETFQFSRFYSHNSRPNCRYRS
jgi:serine/threonine protein kinase